MSRGATREQWREHDIVLGVDPAYDLAGYSENDHESTQHVAHYHRRTALPDEGNFSEEKREDTLWELPLEHHNSVWVGDIAVDYLESAAKSKQPFFAWVSFQDPHDPYRVPNPYHDRYRSVVSLDEKYAGIRHELESVFIRHRNRVDIVPPGIGYA